MKITKRNELLGGIEDLAVLDEAAPAFKALNREGETVSLNDYKGTVTLLSVYPDINTSVCDMQTRHFFNEAVNIEGLKVLNISNNTVEELNEWCATSGLDVDMLSDKDLDFANKYGLYIDEAGILARSIFLIDQKGVLVYKEIIEEITQEPKYDIVLDKAKAII